MSVCWVTVWQLTIVISGKISKYFRSQAGWNMYSKPTEGEEWKRFISFVGKIINIFLSLAPGVHLEFASEEVVLDPRVHEIRVSNIASLGRESR